MRRTLAGLLLAALLLPLALPGSQAHGESHRVLVTMKPFAGVNGTLGPGADGGLGVAVEVRDVFGYPARGLWVFAGWRALGGLASPPDLRTDLQGRAEMRLDVPVEQGHHELLVWTQDEPNGTAPTGAARESVRVGDGEGLLRVTVPVEIVLGPERPRIEVRLRPEAGAGTLRVHLVPTLAGSIIPTGDAVVVEERQVAAGGLQELRPRLDLPSGTYAVAAVHDRSDGARFVSDLGNLTWIRGPEDRGSPGPPAWAFPLVIAALAALVHGGRGRNGRSAACTLS